MAYESERFVEHNKVRIPTLKKLLELGWDRGQIQCPPEEREWLVPKTPSAASRREDGSRFDGFPCDIVIFDRTENKGDKEHVFIIIECKAPGVDVGIDQLELYLAHEPRSRLGVWTNGDEVARVYKLASGGFKVVRGASLPYPGENLLLADESLTGRNLVTPTERELEGVFSDLLDLIVAGDLRTTRPDDRLDQICNLLLVKLDSDVRARRSPDRPVDFQVNDDPVVTAREINALFAHYTSGHRELFGDGDDLGEIRFGADTIQAAVMALQNMNLVNCGPAALSLAFQVFRSANLKSGEGQYFTPKRVVEAAVELMEIGFDDRVIDPACGTGGFLSEAYLQVYAEAADRADAVGWANWNLHGVDKDGINVKIARALMVGFGDGSTHVRCGDSIGGDGLGSTLADGAYNVVLTNPPFGKNLTVRATQAAAGRWSVCTQGGDVHKTTEIGIVFCERAWRLLRPSGRLGIVLPETYFFSKSYAWFREWLDDRFVLRGVLNIPMEAFQGFCRAKTNFYVFQKAGSEAERRLENEPVWFRDGEVWVSYARTIGIDAHGGELHRVSQVDGTRTEEVDNEAHADVVALTQHGSLTRTSRYVPSRPLASSYVGVPSYNDDTIRADFRSWVQDMLPACRTTTLGELEETGLLFVRTGHGSPSVDLRGGDIPYIKVSDLRSGQVNANSSNMVSRTLAERFWRGADSGIQAWDLITPARASKNIGEPSIVLPGGEDIVLTKEVLVLRATDAAPFDGFYLMWALMLPRVTAQWNRVVFMQTNREDLGERWREIEVPLPRDADVAGKLSAPLRRYYTGMCELRVARDRDMARWSV